MHATPDRFTNEDIQQRRRQLLLDFCTHKKRAYVDGVAGYQKPPVYVDVNADTIAGVEQATRTRTHVDTVQFESCAYRFVLMKKADGWRIDSIKRQFPSIGKWENALIGS
ncbi:hypothetical protein Poly51_59740 [Rubripirellula tenax]|uniref:NTF2 fold immunity protein domain-containing protein n=2 Tax=Rubripirellula tenax TaxID=2528015 RepID=A0A5C6E865_9BACT|nr:hypothetical protein Poly51_59740 [Rubripirellula tenax]